MKTHTTPNALIFAFAVLFATSAIAQPNKGRNDRDFEKRGRHNDYYGNKHHEREDSRDCDHPVTGYGNDGDRYSDYGGRNGRYDYPVVRNRPNAPRDIHPGRQPSRHHVFIPAEYRWGKRGYEYYPGYWMVPPRSGMQYVPGFWQPTRNGGYVWVSGFWSNGGFGLRY